MKTPRKLLLAVLTIALISTVAVCSCANTFSILYGQFNDEIWKNYELSSSYTSCTIDVKNFLTYNATTSGGSAKVAFVNDTGSTPEGIQLLLKDDGTLQVWKIEGATEVQIGTGTWAEGNVTRVILGGGFVSVYELYDIEDSRALVVEDFALQNTFDYVRVKGGGSWIAENGYVQVEANVGTAGMQSTIMDYMPLIVTFALLGMVVGIAKKSGK